MWPRSWQWCPHRPRRAGRLGRRGAARPNRRQRAPQRGHTRSSRPPRCRVSQQPGARCGPRGYQLGSYARIPTRPIGFCEIRGARRSGHQSPLGHRSPDPVRAAVPMNTSSTAAPHRSLPAHLVLSDWRWDRPRRCDSLPKHPSRGSKCSHGRQTTSRRRAKCRQHPGPQPRRHHDRAQRRDDPLTMILSPTLARMARLLVMTLVPTIEHPHPSGTNPPLPPAPRPAVSSRYVPIVHGCRGRADCAGSGRSARQGAGTSAGG
jgi:hypothetical protein